MPRRRSTCWRRASGSACSRPAPARRSGLPRRPCRECPCSNTILTAWPPMPTGSSPRRSSHMATGKRASMREGPLADLFRKTTDDEPVATPPEPPETPQAERPAPHPSLDADVDSPVDLSRPEAPSPQERLRAAFSSDLPDDMLEPPAALRDPEPADDVYAVADRGLASAAAPVYSGKPVL